MREFELIDEGILFEELGKNQKHAKKVKFTFLGLCAGPGVILVISLVFLVCVISIGRSMPFNIQSKSTQFCSQSISGHAVSDLNFVRIFTHPTIMR